MRRLVFPVLLVLLVAMAGLGLHGCASGGLAGDIYQASGVAFRIGKAPAAWKRIDVSHAALAFRDEANDATVVVNGRCGVDGEDVPLEALTHHLFMRFTERKVLEQQVVPFDRREALHTILVAKLDGVPMQFDVWVLKKDGCVYDLAYLAPPSRYAGGTAQFEEFVHGFATFEARSHAD